MKWYEYFFNIDFLVTVVLIVIIIYFLVTERNKKKKKKYKFYGLQDGWKDRLPKYDSYSDTGAHEGTVKIETEYKPLFQRPKKKKKKNKHEERCREIFENIYRAPFKSIRPDWLRNPVKGGRNLELDGYNETIPTPLGRGLAFEYDGHQHSKYIPHFHRNGVDDFKYQVKKDTYKDLKCKERGVLLVRIPHFVDYNDLDRYIGEKLRKLNVFPRGQTSYRTPMPRQGMSMYS